MSCPSRLWLLPLAVLFANSSLSAVSELDGIWKGATTCAGQRTDYEIKIAGGAADVSFALHSPQGLVRKRYSASVSIGHDRQGNWASVDGDEHSEQLILRPGRGQSIRLAEGRDMVDCQGFVLNRGAAAAPPAPPAPPAATPARAKQNAPGDPRTREPSRGEMLAALEQLSRDRSSPMYGINILSFEKLGCVKATGKPGYMCDYLIDISASIAPLGSSRADAEHAEAVNLLLNGLLQGAQVAKKSNSGRFLYVEGRRAWIKLDN